MKNRTLLMIPGPIEYEPAVLAALGAPTTSHTAPNFIEAFGQALERTRQVFLSDDGQPFVLPGSGTLALDSVGASLVEAGDKVVMVNTGYFGDRFGALLERYGGVVTHLRAPVGGRPSLEEVEKVLRQGGFKLLVVTHVDTSTGVITEIKDLASLAHDHGAMIVVDGVCSVAGEELRMTEWNVDVALTASQKAIGVPPGLALFVAGTQALQVYKARKTPVPNYYADWGNWLPVMQAYEGRQVGYFGTPAVNLVWALNTSLGLILADGMDVRFSHHVAISRAFKAGIKALGLSQVPRKAEFAANMLTAVRYPQGIEGSAFLTRAAKAGAFLAGGLHPAIKNEYFRVGHMGSTQIGDVLATLGAIEVALKECGYKFQAGAGVEAAAKSYLE